MQTTPISKITHCLRRLVPPSFKLFVIGFTCGLACQVIPASTQEAGTVVEPWASQQPYSRALPLSTPLLEREGYTVSFDGRTKTAYWVYEELTRDSLRGDAKRAACKFQQDPDIPPPIQADLKDYKDSGFDRGHLVPAADCCCTQSAMSETFFLSNISPQIPQFNRGYWQKLERHVRNLTHQYDQVYVITGPLYLPSDAPDGKRYVNYEVIGENDVAVPTHFFKVITASTGDERQQWAYVLPNEPIDLQVPLDTFQITLERIEKISGIVFAECLNGNSNRKNE